MLNQIQPLFLSVSPSVFLAVFPVGPALLYWKKLIQLKFTSSKWLSGNTPSAVIKNSKRAFFSTVRDLIHCVPECFIDSLYKSLLPFQLVMSEMWIEIRPKVTRHLMHLWKAFYYSQCSDQTSTTSQHRSDHCWIHRCFLSLFINLFIWHLKYVQSIQRTDAQGWILR